MISSVSCGMYFEKKPCVFAALFRFVNCLTGLGFPLRFFCFFRFLGVATLFVLLVASPVLVASFFTGSLDHASRLFLLFNVPSLTSCFSANAFNVIFDVSQSCLISSHFDIYIHHPPPLCILA